WRLLDKDGSLGEVNSAEGEPKDVLTQMATEWKEMTDGGWCALSLNNRFVVSLEMNLSRRKGLEELLRTNPKAALGAKAERGKRYQLTHNPESNTSLLLACEEDAIVKLEALFREHGLSVGRVCVGVYAMLLELIDQVRESRRMRLAQNPDGPTGTFLMAALCDGSLCALGQQEEQWTKLRSRTDLFTEEDLTPAVDLLLPMIEESGPETHILVMNDVARPGFVDQLVARVPGLQVSDVTLPHQLGKIMADL
ncbi:MAG TPA: hypothetical protein VLE27_11980, partial [Thermoanaerobaculia bacterium]|nr:hypothetical protein [Thermoanaerobaculia bacterium]